jgi:NADPH-dependent 2,4-dienoyl-CoA reductase/sulfur reductase-like enzyme
VRVVVIGNGIAGITAALRLRRLKPDWSIQVVSGEHRTFFSRPALMYIYMGHMRLKDTYPFTPGHYDRMGIECIQSWVESIDTKAQRVRLDSGPTLPYDRLLIATGSEPNRFGWPGQDLDGVQGFYSLQDLQKLEKNTPSLKRAVIVGGGLIGIELAEMLHTRGAAVTMLVREPSYWANVMPNGESAMINDVIREAGFDLRLETELAEILDDGQGRACAVVTKDGEKIECQLVGLTAGVHPNLSALNGSGIPTGRGVLVDEHLRTSAEHVFAAGDCAEIVRGEEHKVWQVWYTGKAQGLVAAHAMAGEDLAWQPGIWFNSAKFVDLEWHTYGQITCGLDECKEGIPACLYWEHPDRRHAFRIAHQDGTVIGINALGIRFRHRVAERWIAEKRDLEYALAHLGEGNFDPELFDRHEADMVRAMKEQMR